VDAASEQKDWNHYGNSSNNDRFAALDQINVDNVNQLQVAWTFHTGDVPKSTGAGAEDQLTPLQVGDKVFVCTPSNNVIALDADTGSSCGAMTPTPMWAVCGSAAAAWPISMPMPLAQPSVPGSTPVQAVSLPATGSCKRRILMNTIDARLFALNADTGALCDDFGITAWSTSSRAWATLPTPPTTP
jgi:quinate dehydrogenase (quinone)